MQLSFADLEYPKRKRTRCHWFLAESERVTPWVALIAEVAAIQPEGGAPGRPPIGLVRMLRKYIAQQCIGPSGELVDGAHCDDHSVRSIFGIEPGRESAPNATTRVRFRHLLDAHKPIERMSEGIKTHLADRGLLLREGTIVDAMLIAVPPSTTNAKKNRDPKMHQTKMGKQWHVGMTVHIGVDAGLGLTNRLLTTAANVGDVDQAHVPLHREESEVSADAGFQGVEKGPEEANWTVAWYVVMRRSRRKALPDSSWGKRREDIERTKSSIRARVEHPFRVVKNLFRRLKVRYRGLEKNTAQFFTRFRLSNLVLAENRLLAPDDQGAF